MGFKLFTLIEIDFLLGQALEKQHTCRVDVCVCMRWCVFVCERIKKI